MISDEDDKLKEDNLATICESNKYSVYSIKLPEISEILSLTDTLEIPDQEFLENYLEYEIFLRRLEYISQKQGLSKEEAISHALALLEILVEAEKKGKNMILLDEDRE